MFGSCSVETINNEIGAVGFAFHKVLLLITGSKRLPCKDIYTSSVSI
jgi:hypothetical protein